MDLYNKAGSVINIIPSMKVELLCTCTTVHRGKDSNTNQTHTQICHLLWKYFVWLSVCKTKKMVIFEATTHSNYVKTKNSVRPIFLKTWTLIDFHLTRETATIHVSWIFFSFPSKQKHRHNADIGNPPTVQAYVANDHRSRFSQIFMFWWLWFSE